MNQLINHKALFNKIIKIKKRRNYIYSKICNNQLRKKRRKLILLK